MAHSGFVRTIQWVVVAVTVAGLVGSLLFIGPTVQAPVSSTGPEPIQPSSFQGPTEPPSAEGPSGPPSQKGPVSPPPEQ